MGPCKSLNGIKLILDGQGNHLDSITISLELFTSFKGPLFGKPVTGQELFFAVSYSKEALTDHYPYIYIKDWVGGLRKSQFLAFLL